MIRLRRGFTLVEMLVVISIIGLLATLVLPAAVKSRESGRRAKCSNNLHQIMVAMAAYEAKYRTLPPGRVGCDCYEETGLVPCKGLPATKRPGTSGFALILPELDEVPTYQRFASFVRGGVFPGDWGAAYKTVNPKTYALIFPEPLCDDATGWQSVSGVTTAINSRPAVFNCPSNPGLGGGNSYGGRGGIYAGTTSYAMSMGSSTNHRMNTTTWKVETAWPKSFFLSMDQIKYANNGPFIYRTARTSSAVLDGLANTIFLGEVNSTYAHGTTNRWAVGWRLVDSLRTTACNPNGYSGSFSPQGGWEYPAGTNTNGIFSSAHREGAFFAFGDGHVQYIKQDIDNTLFRCLGTIANGPNEAGNLSPPVP